MLRTDASVPIMGLAAGLPLYSVEKIFFPKKKGSINEAKKAPVERQAKVMETLATLMALKKVNQCKAIINPAIKNLNIICNF